MSERTSTSKENKPTQQKPEENPKNKSKTAKMDVNENTDDCPSNNSSGVKENEDQLVHKRFKFLKHALDKVVAKCSSAGKFSWYQTNFPVLAKEKSTDLKHIQEQVIQQLGENIRSEVKLMLEEENMEQVMNDLDVLIHKSPIPKDNIAWRSTGNVKDDVRAHLMPEKMKYRDSLKELLQNLEEENKQLKDVVSHRHKVLLRTKENLNEHTLFFKKVMDTTDSIQKSFTSTEI